MHETDAGRRRGALACTAAGTAGVAQVRTQSVPRGLRAAAAAIVPPGCVLWYALRGAVFAVVAPSSASDYALWIGGSAVFWFVVAAVFLAVARWVRRVRMHDTR